MTIKNRLFITLLLPVFLLVCPMVGHAMDGEKPYKLLENIVSIVETVANAALSKEIKEGIIAACHHLQPNLALEFALCCDNEEIIALLATKGGADINKTSCKDGFSYLHRACTFGNLKRVTCLLNNGADIHLKSAHKHSLSPLGIAISKGNIALVKLLLQKGADPKKSAYSCNSNELYSAASPLSIAAHKNDLTVAKLLIEYGAIIHKEDLFMATVKSDVTFVEYLIEHGATPDKKDGKDEIAYDYALKHNKPDMASYLLLATNFYEAMRGDMSFELFAEKHLTTNKQVTSIQKLLPLDTTKEFTKKFNLWSEKNSPLQTTGTTTLVPATLSLLEKKSNN